jgi:hypothetical protein
VSLSVLNVIHVPPAGRFPGTQLLLLTSFRLPSSYSCLILLFPKINIIVNASHSFSSLLSEAKVGGSWISIMPFTNSYTFVQASSKFIVCVRCRSEVIMMSPSFVVWRFACVSTKIWFPTLSASSTSGGQFSLSSASLTFSRMVAFVFNLHKSLGREIYLFTFCPPGPLDRLKVTVHTSRGNVWGVNLCNQLWRAFSLSSSRRSNFSTFPCEVLSMVAYHRI